MTLENKANALTVNGMKKTPTAKIFRFFAAAFIALSAAVATNAPSAAAAPAPEVSVSLPEISTPEVKPLPAQCFTARACEPASVEDVAREQSNTSYRVIWEANGSQDGDTSSLLAAYRWNSSTSLYARCEAGGLLGALKSLACNFAGQASSGAFSLSGFVWAMSLISFSITMGAAQTLVGGFNSVINYVFSALYEAGAAAGIIFLLVAIVAVGVVKAAFTKNGGAVPAGRLLLLGLTPIILLQAAGNAAANDSQNGIGTTAGSPVWFSNLFTTLASDVSSTVSTSIQGGVNKLGAGVADANDASACAAYVETLEDSFRGNQNLRSISGFWQGTYLLAFKQAQYGDNAEHAAENLYCRQLEAQRGTSRAEQVYIHNASGGKSIDMLKSDGTTIFADFATLQSFLDSADLSGDYCLENAQVMFQPGQMSLDSEGNDTNLGNSNSYSSCTGDDQWFTPRQNRRDPFLSSDNDEFYFHSLLHWDACEFTGSTWEVQAAYRAPAFEDDMRLTPADCQMWWYTGQPGGASAGEGQTALDFDSFPNIDVSGLAENAGKNDADYTSLAEVNEVVDGLNGARQQYALVLGIASFITAIVYAFVFFGISMAVLFSTIGAALMWAALPVTLMLLALQQTRQQGVKLAKMTAGYTFMASLTTIVLSVALALTTAISGLVANALGGTSGDTTSLAGLFLSALAPVIVVYVLRKIMKRAGFDGMMNARGGIGAGIFGGQAIGNAFSNSKSGNGGDGKGGDGKGGKDKRSFGQKMRTAMEKTSASSQKYKLGRAEGKKGLTGKIAGGIAAGAKKKAGLDPESGALKGFGKKAVDKATGANDPESLGGLSNLAGITGAIRARHNKSKGAALLDSAGRFATQLQSNGNEKLSAADARLAARQSALEDREADAQAVADLEAGDPEAKARLEQRNKLRLQQRHAQLGVADQAMRSSGDEIWMHSDGESAVKSVVNTVTGEVVTATELENLGFSSGDVLPEEFAVEAINVKQLAELDASAVITREYAAALTQSVASELSLDPKALCISGFGTAPQLVPSLSLSDVAQMSSEVAFDMALHNGSAFLTEDMRVALQRQSPEVQALVMDDLRISEGLVDVKTGDTASAIAVLSGGRFTVDSDVVAEAQIALQEGDLNNKAVLELEKIKFSKDSFDRALARSRQINIDQSSIRDLVEEEMAHVAQLRARAADQYDAEIANINSILVAIGDLSTSPTADSPEVRKKINKLNGELGTSIHKAKRRCGDLTELAASERIALSAENISTDEVENACSEIEEACAEIRTEAVKAHSQLDGVLSSLQQYFLDESSQSIDEIRAAVQAMNAEDIRQVNVGNIARSRAQSKAKRRLRDRMKFTD